MKIRFKLPLICIGLIGIPLIIGIWESLPTMKLYQLISLLIVGILYNIGYWKIVDFAFTVIDGKEKKE